MARCHPCVSCVEIPGTASAGRLLAGSPNLAANIRAGILQDHLIAAQKAVNTSSSAQRAAVGLKMLSWASSLTGAVASSSAYLIESLAKCADAQAKRLEDASRRAHMAHWRLLVGGVAAEARTVAKPTKLAFRWVKGLAGWQHSPIGSTTENDAFPSDPMEDYQYHAGEELHAEVHSAKDIPLSDQAAVEKQASTWAELWRTREDYCLLEFACTMQHLQPLMPCALRMAAGSFPVGNGLGCDNISPRALLCLSDDALLALSVLLTCFEACGKWSDAI